MQLTKMATKMINRESLLRAMVEEFSEMEVFKSAVVSYVVNDRYSNGAELGSVRILISSWLRLRLDIYQDQVEITGYRGRQETEMRVLDKRYYLADPAWIDELGEFAQSYRTNSPTRNLVPVDAQT